MPIYEFYCDGCEFTMEKIQAIGIELPVCPKCGGAMRKKPSPIAMVKWKGEGGFPSMRKAHKGTAPFTSGYGEYGD